MKTYHRYRRIRTETQSMVLVDFTSSYGTYIPRKHIISLDKVEKVIVITEEFHNNVLSKQIKPFNRTK